jgi:hypothetical protein
MDRMEFMLRFTLTNPDLDTTIVGTRDPAATAPPIVVVRPRSVLSTFAQRAARM